MLTAILIILVLILLAIIFPGFVRKVVVGLALLFGFIIVVSLFRSDSIKPTTPSLVASHETSIAPGIVAKTDEPSNSSNLRNAYNELNTKLENANRIGNQWSYFHNSDAMGKSTIYQAQISSTNSVNFSFPYEGAQQARLTLRIHPRYGNDVILSIEKGQFLCSSYDGCSVLVRFDDDKAVKYVAASAADNSTETLFIRNYARFFAGVLKAKRVRIAASIYHQGEPIFDFDVGEFDENKFRPKETGGLLPSKTR